MIGLLPFVSWSFSFTDVPQTVHAGSLTVLDGLGLQFCQKIFLHAEKLKLFSTLLSKKLNIFPNLKDEILKLFCIRKNVIVI
jgi:hypothetical protein